MLWGCRDVLLFCHLVDIGGSSSFVAVACNGEGCSTTWQQDIILVLLGMKIVSVSLTAIINCSCNENHYNIYVHATFTVLIAININTKGQTVFQQSKKFINDK